MPISEHTNFALSTMASPPSSTDGTELAVATGHGSRFPAAPFNATLWPAGVAPTISNAEIVRVTNKATDTFTIVRAQEGTSGRTHSANDQIAATITKRVLTDAEYGAHKVINVMDPAYGATGDGTTDDRVAIQAAIDAAGAGDIVFFPKPSVRYRITTSALTLATAGVTIEGSGPDCEVRQETADTEVFKATSVSRLTFRNIATYGEGAWSSGWTGNEGHNDRGIHLTNCADFRIENTRHRNHALAGIALRGSCSGEVRNPWIEGTHSYSTPLSLDDNFQMGVFVTYGPSTEPWGHIRLDGGDISGTNQGLVLEKGGASPTGLTEVHGTYFHDIPGQHGIYSQCGDVTIVGVSCRDCALSGVKVQVGTAAASDVANVTITDANVADCGGNAIELAGLDDTYYLRNVRVTGVAYNVDRFLSIVGLVDGVNADIVGREAVGHGVFLGDSGSLYPRRVRIKVKGQDIARHGVYLSLANTASTGIEVEADLYNVGDEPTVSAGTYNGIYLEGASPSSVTIVNPRLVDTGSDMLYGIYLSNSANRAKVFGRVEISGYTAQAIRTIGTITEFPENVDIGATNAVMYTDQTTVRSTGPIRRHRRSASGAGAVTLWAELLQDEGAYLATAEIVGKVSGSAERLVATSRVCFYRDGGGATIEGTADETANTTSGGFSGTYAWAVSGNEARLNVNSVAAVNTDWHVRVTVVRMVGELS